MRNVSSITISEIQQIGTGECHYHKRTTPEADQQHHAPKRHALDTERSGSDATYPKTRREGDIVWVRTTRPAIVREAGNRLCWFSCLDGKADIDGDVDWLDNVGEVCWCESPRVRRRHVVLRIATAVWVIGRPAYCDSYSEGGT